MGSSKANVWRIVQVHHRTYVDANTDKIRWQDIALLDLVPVASAGAAFWKNITLNPATCVGLLTVSGILAALLFGVMLQMSERALSWADSEPERGPATSSHATALEELAANAGYASLVCVLSAIAYVVGSVTHGLALRVSSAIGIGLGVHLVLILMMVMKRVFALTQERLNRARTGADRADRTHRHAS
jgi:hypothetical protein